MDFKKRLTDRKWILLVLALFWALLLVTKRSLYASAGLIVFWIVVLVCSFAAALLLNGMTEKDFLILACLLGIFFLVVAPFPCIIDEDYHFSRAYALSQGNPFPVWDNGTIGIAVPEGFERYADSGEWNLINVWNARELWLSSSSGLEFLARTRSASYLPVDYIFSAAGIWIATLLKLPLLFVVLFGRLFNYAAFTGIAYLAIKKAKYYKSLFFLVATIPCALYGAATISIDASLIAGALLFVSITLNYCLEKKDRIETIDIFLLIVAEILVLSAKYLGYFLIIPFFLFVGKKKPKNYSTVMILLGIVLALITAWQIISVVRFSGSLDADAAFDDVSISGQLAWIFANKGEFLRILLHDFVESMPKRIYACSYSEEPAFSFISLPLRFLPIIAAARARDKYPLELKQGRAFLAYWLIASAVMMLICNFTV